MSDLSVNSGRKYTRIKVCGITSVNDAILCAEAGVDAIGLVFYEKSPRLVSVDIAADISRAVGPFVTVVGLFVDASPVYVQAVLSSVSLHVLQFHGNESEAFCRQFDRPFIKALRIADDTDIHSVAARYNGASGLLLDTYRKGMPGGTGETFNWQLVPHHLGGRITLAGGLNTGNVVQAIDAVKPYAVDVSGGVESAPGVKDRGKIRSFIGAVRELNRQVP